MAFHFGVQTSDLGDLGSGPLQTTYPIPGLCQKPEGGAATATKGPRESASGSPTARKETECVTAGCHGEWTSR